MNIFDPEVIAIGGGLWEAGDLVLEPARRELGLRSTSPSRDLVEIWKATLGARSGMLGAALTRGRIGSTSSEGLSVTPILLWASVVGIR